MIVSWQLSKGNYKIQWLLYCLHTLCQFVTGESLDEPNTNNKLKIATLIHHEKKIKVNYKREENGTVL